jgi:hypothetical protein
MIKRYELKTGARWCMGCRAMVPLEKFPHPQKYALGHFVCKSHHRMKPVCVQAAAPKPPEKELCPDLKDASGGRKAAMWFRAVARKDRLVFGHDAVHLTPEEALALLKEEHIANPSAFAIVPANPLEPISKSNAVVVTSTQRGYLTGMWKTRRDAQTYKRDMAALLSMGPARPPGEAI